MVEDLAAGMSIKESGAHLFLSPDTIKSHRARMMRYLGARNGAHAVAIAIRNGMISVGNAEQEEQQ